MEENMIQIESVHFGYKPRQKLFENLDLRIESGNIYGILGRNGAGKTTIFRLIGGLLFPDSGSVAVLGEDAAERNPKVLSELFFVPEEPFLPKISGSAYVKRYASLYPNFDSQQFDESMRSFEFELSENLHELSYGQKKKFLLSFALATNCSVVLLDEPTNGLDIPAKSSFRKILSGSIDETRAIIIATHQVRDIELLIDPIIIIEDSKVAFNKTAEEISRNLRVKLSEEQPDPAAAYYEKVFGGYAVLEKNESGKEDNIDLELLFNAVTSNAEKTNNLFAKEAG